MWSTNSIPVEAVRLVRFAEEDRKSLTKDDIDRLERFGLVAVFTRYMPTIVRDPNGDEPTTGGVSGE